MKMIIFASWFFNLKRRDVVPHRIVLTLSRPRAPGTTPAAPPSRPAPAALGSRQGRQYAAAVARAARLHDQIISRHNPAKCYHSSIHSTTVLCYHRRYSVPTNSFTMKKQDSQSSSGKGAHGSRPERLLMDSVSSDEGPETESLLRSQLPMLIPAGNRRPRRESLTAPPSPTDSRKSKRDHHNRQHNYMNHLHHLIHWRDIWSGEPHKGNESLHRSESMVSLASFRTLSQLANSDNTNELQQYLASNKNVLIDDRDENCTTALMCACDNGRLGTMRLLVAAGADAAAADADGWTPLAFAARCGHLTIVKELLDAGAKVDSRDCGGWTPLMWASYKGHEDVVALLLEKGADVHAHGNYNINSLVWAAGRRHSGVVLRLLAGGARANSCDKYATSALCWAARAGDVVAAGALLRAGADPNTAGMYCWTPLLQATQGNHSEIVQMILEHKPNVNALDKDGYTALAIACKEGYYDIALALINTGAYINVQDHSKDTPLIHAVKGGHKNIVEALLKKHVDVDLPGKEKKTPVYTAVEKGHVSILKLLLASNPDLEHSTISGDTPLMRAVRSRHAEMVQLLLERKARVNVADNRGDTVLHIAMRARSKQIVEILLRNPKNSQLLYKPNKLNETPYNIDMSYNKTILGQIFGARKLNTNEDNENMLGYELYSAALADMLSEPSLTVPITVGLYARWGSGKSFLLNKLKEEMKNFAKQWSESGWAWSWAVSWGAWHVALSLGAVAAVAGAPLYVVMGLCFALFATFYLALYILWYTGNKYEWWWAGGVLSALGRKFSSLLLVLQVVFCHPPGPNDPRALPATPIRFHFTEGMKGGVGQEGEAMVVQMIASLAEALECQYGRVCTRLARAFRPRPVSSTSGWKWRRLCCIPHIVTFELCFTSIVVGLCVLIMYFTEAEMNEQRREIQQGLLYGACAVSGVLLLANLYTWGRVFAALVLPPRFRLTRALRRDPHATALRPEVHSLTHIVSCLDAFTGQQTRLVVVVDALDSCEQEKVLALLNAVHALCSDPKSPFILLLAIDPHIISKAVEINSRRAFSESNIGGWDYLRNMVQLPFYLQNSALRRVKTAQQTAAKRMQAIGNDDFSTSLQRSVSSRRLSSTSELMSSQERIKNQPAKEAPSSSVLAARTRRLRPSESVASSVASGLHRAVPAAGAADLNRVLLTDDYFSDVNPRSMRRLMNVLYVTGRLLKAFQIEFNWYQLASWVNLTEQWPFRTSWLIYHHETYEEHIDDSTSLKHIYEKVKPLMNGLREASTLMELDRDERKLEVFLSFHRSTLTAADLKIFLPFTINLDPYIKKVIKEEQLQSGAEEEVGGGAAWGAAPGSRHPHSKLFHRKHRASPPTQVNGGGSVPAPPMWVGWANTGSGFLPQPLYPPPPPPAQPHPAPNPYLMLRNAFPGLSDVSNIRLSTLSVDRVCEVTGEALGGAAGAAGAALRSHNVGGLALAVCKLADLEPVPTTHTQLVTAAGAALRSHNVGGLALAVCKLADLEPVPTTHTQLVTAAGAALRSHNVGGLALAVCKLADLEPVPTTHTQLVTAAGAALRSHNVGGLALAVCKLADLEPVPTTHTQLVTAAGAALRSHNVGGLALAVCKLADLEPVPTTHTQLVTAAGAALRSHNVGGLALAVCKLADLEPVPTTHTQLVTAAGAALRSHNVGGLALAVCKLADLEPVPTTHTQLVTAAGAALRSHNVGGLALAVCKLADLEPVPTTHTQLVTAAGAALRSHNVGGLALAVCKLADLEPVPTTHTQLVTAAGAALRSHNVGGLALAVCKLADLEPVPTTHTQLVTAAGAALRSHNVGGLALAVCKLADLEPVPTTHTQLVTAAGAALRSHNVGGLALAVCKLADLEPILKLPFGDWELFKLLIINLRELEANMPSSAPAVTVVTEKTTETEPDTSVKPRTSEHQRSRPSNVEKQVTLEEQMICGALQTLNEEAMEDVLQSEPSSQPDEESTLQLLGGEAGRDPSILRGAGGGSLRRRPDAPAVTFNVESERDSDDDGQITFSARARPPSALYRAPPAPSPPRSRPASLLVARDETPPPARSRSVEDSSRAGAPPSPALDLKLRGLRKTAAILRKVSSAERLTRLKDKIMRGGGSRERSPARDEPFSDDESQPLVSPAGAGAPPGEPAPAPALGVECADLEAGGSAELSPRSDLTELESPRGSHAALDLLPEGKREGGAGGGGGGRVARQGSEASLGNMVEPYNLRLVAEGSRALWRQQAVDSGPPWPWDEPDSPV